jgi:pSer/pThr/pTyr-binding forkhead associated (FHA) protein
VDIAAARNGVVTLGRHTAEPPRSDGATARRRIHRFGGMWAPDDADAVELKLAIVSRRHATVALHEGSLYVYDHTSKHGAPTDPVMSASATHRATACAGTYINRVRVLPLMPHRLRNDDVLEIGGCADQFPDVIRFKVVFAEGVEAASKKGSRVKKRPHADCEAALLNSVMCAMCLEPIADAAGGDCGHCFCYACVTNWVLKAGVAKKCPMCRQDTMGSIRRVRALDDTVNCVLERFGTPEQSKWLELRRRFNNLMRHEPAGNNTAPTVHLYQCPESLHVTVTSTKDDVLAFYVSKTTLRRMLL